MYDRVAGPHLRWGATVLDRLTVAEGATVVDAGCGTGRVTELLLGRLPPVRVIAVDGSRRMLDRARDRLAGSGERVTFLHRDLALPLHGVGPVDAVVSTATFHWIPDHDRLFRNLAGVLRPGGQLVGQWGGAGNIDKVVAALPAAGGTWPGPWTFATPRATLDRLAAAGFEDASAWLEDDPVTFDDPAAYREYLGTLVLGAHLDRLAAADRPAYLDRVCAGLPELVVDYVRLNVVARRGRPGG
ncbi:MAG TPA: methyltransferase domain-containing protein [Candidatus Micrarchaeia archaeon]|nr:methyltransferase domain-containing protein [Candidatus Micrarchaeia archaeon]